MWRLLASAHFWWLPHASAPSKSLDFRLLRSMAPGACSVAMKCTVVLHLATFRYVALNMTFRHHAWNKAVVFANRQLPANITVQTIKEQERHALLC